MSEEHGREQELRERVLETVRDFYHAVHAPKKPFVAGDRIPYAGRVYDDREITLLMEAALDFWLTNGRFSDRFERELATFLQVRHCSLVNSGSSANLLAFLALTSPQLGERRIRPGDEVVTVAAGFPTTVAPILQFGAVPVFVDVELATANMDTGQLPAALSPRTRAVMLAHTLGHPFDLEAVLKVCEEHHLWLIEDNCDALGARYLYRGQWRYTGSLGHLGTSSFYPPHHITMGEGGAVYTNDANLKRIVESLRDWGRDCWCPSGRDNTCGRRFAGQFGELPPGYDHKYVYSHFGFNLKATDLQAAIGCAQLEKLPHFMAQRRENWSRLRAGLADLEDCFMLPGSSPKADPSWFGFLLTVRPEAGFRREEIVRHLEEKGIQTRMLFGGNLLKQPCFDELRAAGRGFKVVGELTNTDFIMAHSFWIGVYPGLTPPMLDYMMDTIRSFVRR
ncbi:MAG: lipopolysaccharide biosynthesis protein RfbH [Desulfobaccales bacterium]